jgi:hypothetical protein
MTTAATINRQVLEPALDGIAENLRQAHLIANATIDIDSLAEIMLELDRAATTGRQRELTRRGLDLVRQLHASNTVEREFERNVAGAADQLVTDLRRIERKGNVSTAWTVKKLARALRAPLADIGNPIITGDRHGDALVSVGRIFEEAPAALILSVGVRHELGVKAFSRLTALHAEFTGQVAA